MSFSSLCTLRFLKILMQMGGWRLVFDSHWTKVQFPTAIQFPTDTGKNFQKGRSGVPVLKRYDLLKGHRVALMMSRGAGQQP